MSILKRLKLAGWMVIVIGLQSVPQGVFAQMTREPDGGALPGYYRYHPVRPDRSPETFYQPRNEHLPVIMLTGYWPPTNEMLRRFSPCPDQNPEGWIGDNWEFRGYNIYAFFPEFPGGLGKGEGDFEVDYQDTSADWWYYTDLYKPDAVICFGRAFENHRWKVESGARNHEVDDWIEDYEEPVRPDPSLPYITEPPDSERDSTLPVDAIMTALTTAGVPVTPVTGTPDKSAFLCNFIGYHACWYHDLHAEPGDPAKNVAAGHIHVGFAMSLETAIWATEVTLRAFTAHLNEILCANNGDINRDEVLTAGDAQLAFLIALGVYLPTYLETCAADCDGNGHVSAADAQAIFLTVMGSSECSDPLE